MGYGRLGAKKSFWPCGSRSSCNQDPKQLAGFSFFASLRHAKVSSLQRKYHNTLSSYCKEELFAA